MCPKPDCSGTNSVQCNDYALCKLVSLSYLGWVRWRGGAVFGCLDAFLGACNEEQTGII